MTDAPRPALAGLRTVRDDEWELDTPQGTYRVRLMVDNDSESPRKWGPLWSFRMTERDGRRYRAPDGNGGSGSDEDLCDLDELVQRRHGLVVDLYRKDDGSLSRRGGGGTRDGIAYLPLEILLKEFGGSMAKPTRPGQAVEQAMSVLDGELAAYEKWATGDVWWHQVEVRSSDSCRWVQLDCCCGHFGHEYAVEEAMDALETTIAREQKRADQYARMC